MRGHAAPWGGRAVAARAALGRGHGGEAVSLSPLVSWREPGGPRALFRRPYTPRDARAQPAGPAQRAGRRAPRHAVFLGHRSGRGTVEPDRWALVVAVCGRRSCLRAPCPWDAVALQRHACRCPLPVTPASPGVSPSGHPPRRLGGLCAGHGPCLSPRPPAALSLARPACRLAPAAGPWAQGSSPQARDGATQGAVAYALTAHRAPPPGHAPRRDPWQPAPSRWGSAPGHTAAAAAGGRLDVAASPLACGRTLLGGLCALLSRPGAVATPRFGSEACGPLHVRRRVRDLCGGGPSRTTRPVPSASGG